MELSFLDLAQEVLPGGAPRFGTDVLAQAESAHLERPVVEPVGIERRWKAAGVARAYEVAIVSQRRQAQLLGGLADAIEYDVHSLAMGRGEHAFQQVVAVEQGLSAQSPHSLRLLLGGDGPQDPCAGIPGQL